MKPFVLIIILLASAFVNSLSGQEKVEGSLAKQMIEQVQSAAASLNSMECKFRQTKSLSLLKTEMISTGKMAFKEGMLRWEYLLPYNYLFILKGDSVLLGRQQQLEIIDVKSSKLFSKIAELMVESLTGRGLGSDEFEITLYTTKEHWVILMHPVAKETAQLFESVELYVNPIDKGVSQIKMKEKSGDTTTIELLEIKKNSAPDDSLFEIK